MSGPRFDIHLTPRCPDGCFGDPCVNGRHEVAYAHTDAKFLLIAMRLRHLDPPLSFLPFAGIALMVNAAQRSVGPVPLNWFEECSTCGAGSEGCDCEPNILAILAKEGGSEWQ